MAKKIDGCLILVLMTSIFLVGCPSDDVLYRIPACEPGARQECLAEQGCKGYQFCKVTKPCDDTDANCEKEFGWGDCETNSAGSLTCENSEEVPPYFPPEKSDGGVADAGRPDASHVPDASLRLDAGSRDAGNEPCNAGESRACQLANPSCAPSTQWCEFSSPCTNCAPTWHWGNCLEPALEICNGIDDDCDNVVDNDDEVFLSDRTSNYPSLNIENGRCYPEGQYPGTRNVGICTDGYPRCVDANLIPGDNGPTRIAVCLNAQTPLQPNCISNPPRDHNCDGAIDQPSQTNNVYADIVLFLDRSGSMGEELDTVITATIDFAVQTQAWQQNVDNVRVAVIEMPGQSEAECGVIRIDPATGQRVEFGAPGQAFMRLDQAIQILDSLRLPENGGSEPTWDCPYIAAREDNYFNLEFRPTAKKVFINFSDEEGQTYLGNAPWQIPNPSLPPGFNVNEHSVGQILAQGNGLHAPGSIQYNSFDIYASSYDYMVQVTGGQRYPLDSDSTTLRNNLITLLNGVTCQ